MMDMHSLKEFGASNNEFTGEIGWNLLDIPLETLLLHYNHLTGEIPGYLDSVDTLTLFGNDLRGMLVIICFS